METGYHHSISNGLVLEFYSNRVDVIIVDANEDKRFSKRIPFTQFTANLLDNVSELGEIFNWVKLYFCTTGFTLVPSKIDDEQERKLLFASQHRLAPDFSLNHVPLRNDMDLLFAEDINVVKELKAKFPSLSVHHQAERFVKHIHGQLVNRNLQVFVGGQLNQLLVAVYHAKGLEFLNSFSCSDANDAFYFTMLVVEQLDLAPEQLELNWLMSEEELAHSEVEALFQAYVKEITFHKEGVVLA